MTTRDICIGIIMGSQSDWEIMKNATETLTALDIPFETKIVSAHRTPDRLYEYAKVQRTEASRSLLLALVALPTCQAWRRP